MSRLLAIGDLHGGHRSLVQALHRSSFDYEHDKLVITGDVVDGWPDSRKVVTELNKVKHKHFVIGNHDQWFMDYLRTGLAHNAWLSQGGAATLRSYGAVVTMDKVGLYNIKDYSVIEEPNIPISHKRFFESGTYYHIQDGNLFIHGGFNPSLRLEQHDPEDLMWDRDIALAVMKGETGLGYDNFNIFLGHTSTSSVTIDGPVNSDNIWLIDQGGGFEGKLTIMDVETKEFWQSDKVSDLYPDYKH